MLHLFLLVTVFGALYFYLKYHYGYWERMGVPGPKPTFFLGNMVEVLRLRKNLGKLTFDIYNDYKNSDCDVIGYYKFLTPAIIVRSPELVSKIVIEDFSHFLANNFQIGNHDKITSRNPFMQSGTKWKETRATLTPAFTTGKLKSMVPLTNKACLNMVDYIMKNIIQNESTGFAARDIFNRYSTDNTASVAFGIEINSFSKDDCEFMEMGQKTLNLNMKAGLRFMIIANLPYISKLFNLLFIPKSVSIYFRNIILKVLKQREMASNKRNDFLNQMILNREKYGEEKFGEVDIVAQSISFLVNGVEASSATMGFLFFLISKDLEVQRKAQRQVDLIFEKYNGDLTYEALKEMTYLDQVINETFRLYPGALISGKKCTKTYVLPATDERSEIVFKSGTPVVIPIGALQRDEKYWPNPDKFDPERFSPENIGNIQKHTYLPFGQGPRTCLGQKFALLQTKLAVARIIKEFDVRVNKNTIEPFVFTAKSFLLRSERPIYLNFYKRKNI